MIHTKAIKWLGRYFKHTRSFGYVMKPDFTKGLELSVDSDWSGNWDVTKPESDTDTAHSRYGFIVWFAGVPIFHASRLMSLIALSSTEAEYIALSEATREVLPLIDLIEELKKRGFDMPKAMATARCEVFEDNSGAIEIANGDKYRPRTMHINVRYHHFHDYVQRGVLQVTKIASEDNPVDILTHPVNEERLAKHITDLLHWDFLSAVSEGVLDYLTK